MKNLPVLIVLLLISVRVQAQTLSNHYKLDVVVDPARQFVKSHCNLRFVADKDMKEVTYWMNTAFQPIEVMGQDVDSVWFTDGLIIGRIPAYL